MSNDGDRGSGPLGFFATFILAYAFWIILNLSLQPQVLAAGAVVALIVAAIASRTLFTGLKPDHLNPARPLAAIGWSLGFLKALAIANLTMTGIILSPKPALRPGVARVQLGSTNDWVVAGVANSITMTPGTLTVDAGEGDGVIYVHCVQVEDDPAKAKESIVGSFERWLARVFA